MKTITIAATAAAILGATPAVARQDGKPDDAARGEKRICRSVETTGSIMRRQECHTATEWKEKQQRDSTAADELRSRAIVGDVRPN